MVMTKNFNKLNETFDTSDSGDVVQPEVIRDKIEKVKEGVDDIKKATVSYLTGSDSSSASREYTYSVTPRAIKNYTGDIETTLAGDITAKSIYIEVADASGLTDNTYINIGAEELYIKSISGNKLTVRRGEDNTTAAIHVNGADVKKITPADNALVESGDDFGFDGAF